MAESNLCSHHTLPALPQAAAADAQAAQERQRSADALRTLPGGPSSADADGGAAAAAPTGMEARRAAKRTIPKVKALVHIYGL